MLASKLFIHQDNSKKALSGKGIDKITSQIGPAGGWRPSNIKIVVAASELTVLSGYQWTTKIHWADICRREEGRMGFFRLRGVFFLTISTGTWYLGYLFCEEYFAVSAAVCERPLQSFASILNA
ncbi:hypothetical protein C4E44_08190 [Pseudomonas sp. MWU12-2312b]|nr:hypothetical protein C4E44_08190 [Pseudomonas sp. MWU12-2312b]